MVGYWDAVAGFALIFTAIVTPYEVGFIPASNGDDKWLDGLFITNRVIDVIFLLDMCLQFFVAVQIKDRLKGSRWVLDNRQIAINYVTSRWFYLDFFSIGTSGFDLFGSGDASNLSALRVMRALRLVKLVRLLRGSRMLTRYEKRLNINYAYLGLVKIVVMITTTCHWFACIWGLQASFHRLNSWMSSTGYCNPLPADGSDVPRAAVDALLAACPPDKACEFRECGEEMCSSGTICESSSSQYIYALYWAVVTITSVGYGDISAVAYNPAEQLINTAMVLFGGMEWALLVGTFCGLAAQLDPELRERREHLSALNGFMSDAQLPPFLRFRLREYFFEAAHVHKAVKAKELLAHVSPALQGEVALTISSHRLDKVWYMYDLPTVLKIELANRLRPLVLPQGEQAPPGFLYVLERGTILYSARVLRAPNVWGEDVLLQNEALQLNCAALAITYLWLYVLDSEALEQTLEVMPKSSQHLEAIRFRWACRRMFVRAAEKVTFEQGRRFYGRLYPIYGIRQVDGNVEAATTLGRTKSHSKNALEWWDVDDDFEERREIAGELADVGKLKRQGSRMSPVSSFHKKVNSSARPSSPTLGLMKAKKTKKEQANEEAEARAKEARVQKSIAIAARLFGASKMRRGFIGDKVQLHDAQLKLQADVDALAKSQHALAMSMNEGLRAVAAGLKELAERQGGGAAGRAPSASVVEALESVIHARPHSPVGSLYGRPGGAPSASHRKSLLDRAPACGSSSAAEPNGASGDVKLQA